METRYDPEADAVYFTLGTTDILESEEVAPDVILDFDAENRVVGIEVLHATRTLSPGAWSGAPIPGTQAEAATDVIPVEPTGPCTS